MANGRLTAYEDVPAIHGQSEECPWENYNSLSPLPDIDHAHEDHCEYYDYRNADRPVLCPSHRPPTYARFARPRKSSGSATNSLSQESRDGKSPSEVTIVNLVAI